MFLNEDIFDVFYEDEMNKEVIPQGPDTGVDTGVADLLLSLINSENDTIKDYNSFIANLDSHPEFISVIEDITNEEMKHVGQLQTLLSKISPNVESIESGKEEAEGQLKESINEEVIDAPTPGKQANEIADYLNRFITYSISKESFTEDEIEKMDEVIDLLYNFSKLNESVLQDLQEDIQNLERVMKSERVDAVGSMPITMLDAVEESEKVQDEIEKEMEEHSEKVKLNKVLGAEEQPVPEYPEVPKIILEESLFEDYIDDNYKLVSEIEEYVREGHIDPEDLLHKLLMYYYTDPSFRKFVVDNDIFSEADIDFIVNENLMNNNEDGWGDEIKNLLDPVIDNIDRVSYEVSNCVRGSYGVDGSEVEDLADTLNDCANDLSEISDELENEADRLNEGRKRNEEEYDLFSSIQDELCSISNNFRKRTLFPDVKINSRYDISDVGVEYNKDGFADITIRQPSMEDFEFAFKVANTYGVETVGPKEDGPNQYKLIIRVPEENNI